MTSVKNGLAAIGTISIIAIAGLAIGFGIFSGNPSDDSDAASSSDIKSDLNKYADILNNSTSTMYLYVNSDIFYIQGSSLHNYTQPIKGTVKVEGLNLAFDNWFNNEHTLKNHWVVPYHAISGIREANLPA